jgi:hypothetical protein
MDFTLDQYESLLIALKKSPHKTYTVKEWIRQKPQEGILLRHDVDRWPKNALEMAALEAKYSIESTYYFRIGKHTFVPSIIKEISAMGHEIGYHYEDLSLAGGDYQKAIALFSMHLEKLREIVPIDTIAMHGRPLSKFDNRDLWKAFKLQDHSLLGEAFLSIDYSSVYYHTDTGRSWSESSINLRDSVNGLAFKKVSSTNSLIRAIKNNAKVAIALVAHPERWNNGATAWSVYFLFDMTVNIIKSILRYVR